MQLKEHTVSFREATAGVISTFLMRECRSVERKDSPCIPQKPKNGNTIPENATRAKLDFRAQIKKE